MKISLIGYMGAGKSVIGRKLARELDLNFIDLDQYIEQEEDMRISEIFKKKGEIQFRKMEHRYLKDVLSKKAFVLSTGGGTPVFYNQMDLINQNTISYYLYATPHNLSQRLLDEKNHRPMIAHIKEAELPEFIAKHLFERNPFYQLANHTIHTNGKSIDDIVSEIKTHQNRS